MKKNYQFMSLLTILLLMVISGCQPAQNPTANPENNPEINSSGVQNIQVDKVSPQKSSGSFEEFPLPNCGGTGKLTQSLGTQVSVSKGVQMGITVSVTGGGNERSENCRKPRRNMSRWNSCDASFITCTYDNSIDYGYTSPQSNSNSQ